MLLQFEAEETRMIIKKVIDNGEVKYWGMISKLLTRKYLSYMQNEETAKRILTAPIFLKWEHIIYSLLQIILCKLRY